MENLTNGHFPSEFKYEFLDNILPVIFFSLFLSGLVLVYLYFKGDPCHHLIYGFSKIVFSDLEASTVRNTTIYTLFKAPISHFWLCLIFMVSASAIDGALVVAWEAFLLSETSRCDEGYDCYDDKNGTYIQDCTEVSNRDISCYKLVYRFDLAVGAMGGVLVIASKSIKFYGNCVMPLWKYFTIRYGRTCANLLFISALPVVTVVSEVVVVAVLTVAGQLDMAKEVCTCLAYLTTVFLAAIGTSIVICQSASGRDQSGTKRDEEAIAFKEETDAE